MSGFPLAGLLRLRGIQERAAAERLSRAQIAARQTEARERRMRAALADTGEQPGDVRTMAALAASRAASRAQLSELSALASEQGAALSEAQREHSDAKRQARGLEKLEVGHLQRERARELQAEQTALDEIATGRWKRGAA